MIIWRSTWDPTDWPMILTVPAYGVGDWRHTQGPRLRRNGSGGSNTSKRKHLGTDMSNALGVRRSQVN